MRLSAGRVARFWTRRAVVAGAIICLLALLRPAWSEPVSYAVREVAGLRLHVITADLNDPRVRVSPALAKGGCGRAESFSSFVSRLHPLAAVNGTFFSKRDLRPIGDIVVQKRLVHFGGMGTALAFTNDGVDAIRLPSARHVDWGDYQCALAAGPLLVWNGFAKPAPGGEGFGDPHVFAKAAARTAMGITAQNKLLLVTTITPASLGRLAQALRDLGARYAVNLDGGASCAMYYQGRTIKGAGRPLTNVLYITLGDKPAAGHALRAPRGLDWRGGHDRPPKPSTSAFPAGDVEITIEWPVTWEGEQTLRLRSKRPLPPNLYLQVQLDRALLYNDPRLPAEVRLNVFATNRRKHTLWIGVVDTNGHILGRYRRYFEGPTTARIDPIP